LEHLVMLGTAELLLRLTCKIERLQIRSLLHREVEQCLLIGRRGRTIVRVVNQRVLNRMIETEHLIERSYGGVCIVLRIELK
jgi:hypothetical protein